MVGGVSLLISVVKKSEKVRLPLVRAMKRVVGRYGRNFADQDTLSATQIADSQSTKEILFVSEQMLRKWGRG